MSLTGAVPAHPAQYSPEILEVLGELIEPGERIHDPFAGLGLRLGALCDEIGAEFTGTDIEPWAGIDLRVDGGDSTLPLTYPERGFTVCTSPVYFGNRISSDYVNGPTETTKRAGRRAYGISLGRALAGGNLARACRPAHEDRYYELHSLAVRWWGERVLLNVDRPLGARWEELLSSHGYEIRQRIEVGTRRYRVGGDGDGFGAGERAECELVIEAGRSER